VISLDRPRHYSSILTRWRLDNDTGHANDSRLLLAGPAEPRVRTRCWPHSLPAWIKDGPIIGLYPTVFKCDCLGASLAVTGFSEPSTLVY